MGYQQQGGGQQPVLGPALAGIYGLTNNPWDKYRRDLTGTPTMLDNYYNPYLSYDESFRTPYKNALQSLMNPTAFENSIMSQYQTSPAAQYQMDQAQKANERAAAAGGIAGTPAEMQALDKNIQGIAAQGQQQYYQNAIQPYEYGISGMGHMLDQGSQMTMDKAHMMGNYYHDLGAVDYGGGMEEGQSWGMLGSAADNMGSNGMNEFNKFYGGGGGGSGGGSMMGALAKMF